MDFVYRNDYLSVLIINQNPYTVDGVLKFLKYFINDRTVLQNVTIDSRPYTLLNHQADYHNILSRRHGWLFKVHPPLMKANFNPCTSAAAQLVELPAEFSRRDVLK